MTEQRQCLLEEAGFVWDPQTDVWEIPYREFKEYKRRHVHCNVPSRYAEENHPRLASWIKRQRRQFKQIQRGEVCVRLPMIRFARLDNMGFVWNICKETVGRGSSTVPTIHHI